MAALQTDDRGVITACPSCGQKNRLAYNRLSDTVRCGRCKAELPAAAAPVEVATAADFDHLVTSSSVPIVVDFWAPWCGPCQMIAPALHEIAREGGGRFRIAKVNVDDETELAQRFRIRGIPALLFFSDGQLRHQIDGFTAKKVIVDKLESLAAAKSAESLA